MADICSKPRLERLLLFGRELAGIDLRGPFAGLLANLLA